MDEILTAAGWENRTALSFTSTLASPHSTLVTNTRREADMAQVLEIAQ